MSDAVTVFLGIIFEATPFILLGVIISSILHLFIKDETILRLIPKNPFLGVLASACFGFLFPVCECGNIPVAKRLLQKNVPPFMVTTFLLAAPVFNPIVIFSTMVAFKDQPEMVWMRVGFSLLIACSIGLLMSRIKNPSELIVASAQHHNSASCCSTKKHRHSLKEIFPNIAKEFLEMMSILILGAFIAAVVQGILPRNFITAVGNGPILSIICMMLLAAVISICSTVDAFFALSYTAAFTSPSILAFLIFGPMIDIKTIIMLRGIYKGKTIFWITILTGLMTLAITLFMNLHIS
ncbi:MAG: permease [Candidatus Gracilibacteria bacterium]